MHGPLWLENTIISVLLSAVAFYLLYKAVATQKHLRHHQHSNGNNVERELFGHKIIDTNKGCYSSHLL
jgi:hypothetical protein